VRAAVRVADDVERVCVCVNICVYIYVCVGKYICKIYMYVRAVTCAVVDLRSGCVCMCAGVRV